MRELGKCLKLQVSIKFDLTMLRCLENKVIMKKMIYANQSSILIAQPCHTKPVKKEK